jgi:hypothetical protein
VTKVRASEGEVIVMMMASEGEVIVMMMASDKVMVKGVNDGVEQCDNNIGGDVMMM